MKKHWNFILNKSKTFNYGRRPKYTGDQGVSSKPKRTPN